MLSSKQLAILVIAAVLCLSVGSATAQQVCTSAPTSADRMSYGSE
jgi:hypothetical protein